MHALSGFCARGLMQFKSTVMIASTKLQCLMVYNRERQDDQLEQFIDL